jgi:hypothetical protein
MYGRTGTKAFLALLQFFKQPEIPRNFSCAHRVVDRMVLQKVRQRVCERVQAREWIVLVNV